jgi:ParB family transcriptional regulator, chromosome partitioning protein
MPSKKPSGLGRGLDALFSAPSLRDDVLEVRQNGAREIALHKITPSPNQPRSKFDQEKIEQLAFSIKEHGVLQPIVISENSAGHYSIIAGERRYRASVLAGLTSIPAVVRSVSDNQKLEIALVENVQREDLNPIELALGFKRLHDDFSMSYDDIGKRIGKAHSTVQNIVRLLGLPAPQQQALVGGTISEGHARSLLGLSHKPDAQLALFSHIVNKHWSVRQAELFVKVHKDESITQVERIKKMSLETAETKTLGKRLKTKVTIHRSAHGGRIALAFKDEDDLERLLNLL